MDPCPRCVCVQTLALGSLVGIIRAPDLRTSPVSAVGSGCPGLAGDDTPVPPPHIQGSVRIPYILQTWILGNLKHVPHGLTGHTMHRSWDDRFYSCPKPWGKGQRLRPSAILSAVPGLLWHSQQWRRTSEPGTEGWRWAPEPPKPWSPSRWWRKSLLQVLACENHGLNLGTVTI